MSKILRLINYTPIYMLHVGTLLSFYFNLKTKRAINTEIVFKSVRCVVIFLLYCSVIITIIIMRTQIDSYKVYDNCIIEYRKIHSVIFVV